MGGLTLILQSLLRGPTVDKRDGTSTLRSPAAWLIDALGGQPTAAGTRVNETTALGLPAVYACVRVLAEAVAQLPLVLYRQADRQRLPATEHPLYRLVSAKPNPEHTSFIWRELTMAHLAAWGNSYHLLVRRRGGKVAEIWPLRPDAVRVERDGRRKVFRVSEGKGGEAVLGPDEVLHIPGIGFDGMTGWSPIRTHREAIGWGLATQEFSAQFFGNGAQPQGVLTHPGRVDKPEELKKEWQDRNSGANRLGIAVLQQGMKYEQMSISPDDAQFVQTRALQIADICRIFKVPPTMIQDYGRATWSNAEQADLAFVKHTVVPWLTRIEAALNTTLLSEDEQQTLFFKFKVQGLLRGDNAGRAQFYNQGVTGGWMTRNEVRELEDLDPLDGLDEPLTPVSAAQKDNPQADDPNKSEPEPPPADLAADDAEPDDRAIVLGVAERALAREVGELRRLRTEHHEHDEWLAAVNEFYRSHSQYLQVGFAIASDQVKRFLDARWRDLEDPATVKSTLKRWADAGPTEFLEAIRHA